MALDPGNTLPEALETIGKLREQIARLRNQLEQFAGQEDHLAMLHEHSADLFAKLAKERDETERLECGRIVQLEQALKDERAERAMREQEIGER